MLVSIKAASAGLSAVACVAILLAFVKYAKSRPFFENASKFLNQIWLHIKHENRKQTEAKNLASSELEPSAPNMNCAFNDIKLVRKAMYPYVLAISSAIIIMAVCGKLAKSPSLVLQMSSVVSAFMLFGAALMAIGLFAFEPNDATETAPAAKDKNVNKHGLESVVSTLGLALMGCMVVSYVVNCGLSA